MLIKFLTSSLFFTVIAFAEEHGGATADHSLPVKPLLLHALNLLIFVLLVYKFAGKQIGGMFASRAEDMERDLKNAEAEMARINSEIQTYENLIGNFESEKRKMFASAEDSKRHFATTMTKNLSDEETRLQDDHKKSKQAEDIKQEKILKDNLVAQVLQMAKNELLVKAKSKDVHFNLRQELQENLKNDRI